MSAILLSFILAISFLQVKETKNSNNNLQLTRLSEELLDMFIMDDMNAGLDTLSILKLVFINDAKSNLDLYICDGLLESACFDNIYLMKYKGFHVFYNGDIKARYIIKKPFSGNYCNPCDSILQHIDKSTFWDEYDPNMYDIKIENNKIIIERYPGR